MNISQIMSTDTQYLSSSATLADAARKMREFDCGFLPIADDAEEKLQGVVTDRDIVVRGIARGLDPKSTSVDEVRSNRVLYCYQADDLETAATNMREQQVSRLIVLSDPESKKLCGVVSLGDITRNTGNEQLSGRTTRGIKEEYAHTSM